MSERDGNPEFEIMLFIGASPYITGVGKNLRAARRAATPAGLPLPEDSRRQSTLAQIEIWF